MTDERVAHDTWFRAAAQNGQPISTLFAWLECARVKDLEIARLRRQLSELTNQGWAK